MIDFFKSSKFYLPVIYIVLGVLIYAIVGRLISRLTKSRYVDKKKITIMSLIKNIFKYLISILVVLMILQGYGVNTTGIIASIGVFGVVIGFAFQDLVADFLAGVAIIYDNRYMIGDVISIDGFKGTVISFGLMSTKIKAFSGEVKIINNSAFKEVINYSLNNSMLLVSVDVDYKTDIDKLERALKGLAGEVKRMANVNGEYKLLGINELASSSIKYLVSIECVAEGYYQVKRDYLKLVKRAFDKEGIVIPYNKIDVSMGGTRE